MATEKVPAWPALTGHALVYYLLLSALIHVGTVVLFQTTASPEGSGLIRKSNSSLEARLRTSTASLENIGAGRTDNIPTIAPPRGTRPEESNTSVTAAPTLTAEAVLAFSQPEESPEANRPEDSNDLLNLLDDSMAEYLTLKDLDLPPYMLEELPADPVELQGRRESGRMVLEVWVDKQGSVTRIRSLSNELPSVFAEAMASMLRMTDFVPAKKNGQNVNSRMTIEFQFAPPPDEKPSPRKLGRIR